MENTNAKFITVSYMITGILVGIVFSVLVDTLAAVTTGSFGRFVSTDLMRHVIPVGVGLVTFLVLQFNAKVGVWADEVVSELRRIVWPSRKDTMAMTVVVCIMLLISGVLLGVLDVMSGALIDWLLHRNFMGLFS